MENSTGSSRQRTTSINQQPSKASSSASALPTSSGITITHDKDGQKLSTVQATAGDSGELRELTYSDMKVIGNGSFGVVFRAKITGAEAVGTDDDVVAIKKVLQDKRFKNRELQIMRLLAHINIVKLKYFFHSNGEKKDDVYLNLVLEFVPETVYRVSRHYSKKKQSIPNFYVKLYMYQLFRSLAYIHSLGICHRDIKPQNLLLNHETGTLKLCDFGSAKILVKGEPNVSYICSRYYRAPELIFGATDYSTAIDVWSAGCVLAEMLLGQPLFPGDSGVNQLVEIIRVLGTPSREQIQAMNSNYTDFKFPQWKTVPWAKVFRPNTIPEAIEITEQLLIYMPDERITPIQALRHRFFDELCVEGACLPNGGPLPELFNFTADELKLCPELATHFKERRQ